MYTKYKPAKTALDIAMNRIATEPNKGVINTGRFSAVCSYCNRITWYVDRCCEVCYTPHGVNVDVPRIYDDVWDLSSFDDDDVPF